jgi:RNA polymerase sigma-70 factor (ECF subfamily)
MNYNNAAVLAGGSSKMVESSASDVTSRFNEIYYSTYNSVVAFVTAKCGNTADIADIVQDTYVEVYRVLSRRGVDYIKEPKAISLKIARQKLSKYYTAAERLKALVPLNANRDSGDFGESDFTDWEQRLADDFLTEDFIVDKLLIAEVKALIREKPQDVKKVFYLFYDMGLTIPQIAKTMSMTESNVKHKLYRTLKELRSKFKL